MILKIILTLGATMVIGSSLFGNVNTNGSSLLQENISIPQNQKKLNTKKDFDRMVADLQQGVKLGDMNSLFYLGFVYFESIELADGTKTVADRKKAVDYLLRAISLGSKESAAFLMAKSLELKDSDTMANATKAIQGSQMLIIDKDYFSMMLASFILDYNVSDANATEVAMKWLYEAEKKRPSPKMQLILAFMYQKIQNMDAANFYLNKSCSYEEMRETCEQIKKIGGKDGKSCQKF